VLVFQIRDGRVSEVRQYFEDTAENDQFWSWPGGRPSRADHNFTLYVPALIARVLFSAGLNFRARKIDRTHTAVGVHQIEVRSDAEAE
jgi:hypothetical protein